MKSKGVLLKYEQTSGIVELQLVSDFRREFAFYYDKYRKAIHTFDFHKWYKKKSTGEESQNNHAWGHSRQIAQEIGDDPREVLREACLRCNDYPKITTKIHLVPKPWSEANSKEAAAVIETLHRIAAFLNIRLVENFE